MAVTVTRISPTVRQLQGPLGVITTELQAESGASVILTRTIRSEINLQTPDAKNKLYAMHREQIDQFRADGDALETAIAATPDVDTQMDTYIAGGNPT